MCTGNSNKENVYQFLSVISREWFLDVWGAAPLGLRACRTGANESVGPWRENPDDDAVAVPMYSRVQEVVGQAGNSGTADVSPAIAANSSVDFQTSHHSGICRYDELLRERSVGVMGVA